MERNKDKQILVDDGANTILVLEDVFLWAASSISRHRHRWDAFISPNDFCETRQIHHLQNRWVVHIYKILAQDRIAHRATEFLDTLVDLSEAVDDLGWIIVSQGWSWIRRELSSI